MLTTIGESGAKLSGGERQRLGIARALVRQSPIIILDEATSSLDSETEALVMQEIREISRHKTVILIAHRLSTITHADHIIVLESGSVVEQGNHTELLAARGTYASLWETQSERP